MKKFNKKTLKLTTKLIDVLLKDTNKIDPIILRMYN